MKKILVSILLIMFLAAAAYAKVNINTAGVDELKELKGIGQSKAEAIVKHREEHGNFKNKEELVAVKGIGDKLYSKISDEVEVSE
ncbi:MAG: helix-hairpin-helix domain-containing protein [Desulfobulbaceae bacterium]|nr:helix-hairpin-helix domain-containing protein [Desulfobulbaceae bacterium]